MTEAWRKARKKAVVVEFREVNGDIEAIHTLEGTLIAHREKSFIIRGLKGELYPIDKKIFAKTYEIIGENQPDKRTQLEQLFNEIIADIKASVFDMDEADYVEWENEKRKRLKELLAEC